ncbi:hypothetical protein NEDG_00060 [Nematocida displodere]|uniref:NADP-dependent oxidoreductase domain-containing protein n=1 Tax=Nematocida displodere TaxID=1805483 RepID=A0A177EHY7_9MICR|nr:hypothetical protein NEDG_00060 [Nematocida displodere]
MKTLPLSTGDTMSVLGLGTYEMPKDEVSQAIRTAMNSGYRLYDTAQVYKNQKEVSEGIKATGIDRKSVFITTKVATSNQGYERAKASVRESLETMGVEYLDLVLIHWPGAKGLDLQSREHKSLRHGSYRALLELQKEGAVRNVGVSNFMVGHLTGLFEEFEEKPQVNQIELSPICFPRETADFCQANGVVVQSYSTLGRGLLLSEEWVQRYPVLKNLKNQGSISARVLKWAINKNFCVIPKSITPSRIEENFSALSVDLSPEDEQALDEFPVSHRTCWDPNTIL